MAWQPIEDTGIPARTAYRLAAADKIPSKTDEAGRRVVWIEPGPDTVAAVAQAVAEEVGAEVRELRAELAELRKTLEARPGQDVNVTSGRRGSADRPENTRTASDRTDADVTPAPKRKRPSSSGKPGKTRRGRPPAWSIKGAIPADDAALVRALAATGLSAQAVEQAAGIGSTFCYKLRRGTAGDTAASRSSRAALRAWLAERGEQREAG